MKCNIMIRNINLTANIVTTEHSSAKNEKQQLRKVINKWTVMEILNTYICTYKNKSFSENKSHVVEWAIIYTNANK